MRWVRAVTWNCARMSSSTPDVSPTTSDGTSAAWRGGEWATAPRSPDRIAVAVASNTPGPVTSSGSERSLSTATSASPGAGGASLTTMRYRAPGTAERKPVAASPVASTVTGIAVRSPRPRASRRSSVPSATTVWSHLRVSARIDTSAVAVARAAARCETGESCRCAARVPVKRPVTVKTTTTTQVHVRRRRAAASAMRPSPTVRAVRVAASGRQPVVPSHAAPQAAAATGTSRQSWSRITPPAPVAEASRRSWARCR